MNSNLTISGFGIQYNMARGWSYASHLQKAHIKMLPIEYCFNRRQESDLAFKGHFCAGEGHTVLDHPKMDQHIHADSCKGDSGGPATLR